MGSGDVAMLAQTVEQLVFKFTPLIMVNPLGESKMWYEIVEQPDLLRSLADLLEVAYA